MSNEKQIVAVQHEIAPVSITGPMSLLKITEMATLVMQVCEKLFLEGTHYGKVPGTTKNTLFQAGAQKFALLFHLSPSFDCERLDLANDHREYIVKATIKCNGSFVAEGVGSCSTMESKYRFRNSETAYTPTGNILPQTYWKLKSSGEKKRLLAQVMDDTVGRYDAKKVNGNWQIVQINEGETQKVEHPNIADVYNTVLKMAKKRSYVDAILNATGASDTFTQDLEELEENLDALRAYESEHGGQKETRQEPQEEPERQEPVSSPSKAAKTSPRASSQPERAEKQAQESVGLDWRKVEVHIKSSIKGRKLGDLTILHLKTAQAYLANMDMSKATQSDKRLKLAVELGIKEIEASNPPEEKPEPKQEEFRAPPNAPPLPEEKPEQSICEDTSKEIEESEPSSDFLEDLDRLRDLVRKEGMTEEDFVSSAKENNAITKEWPGRNLDDIDEPSLVALFIAQWEELMIAWGERKPANPAKKK